VKDDDRPRQKKSWREIDKMRDRSGGLHAATRRAGFVRAQHRLHQVQTNLERLFSGGRSVARPPQGKARRGRRRPRRGAEAAVAIEDPRRSTAAGERVSEDERDAPDRGSWTAPRASDENIVEKRWRDSKSCTKQGR